MSYSMVGKTVAWEDGNDLYFTDGTSFIEEGDYEQAWHVYHDWAATQAAFREKQGERERERVRHLGRMRPEDAEVLDLQKRVDWERRYNAASPFGKMTMNMMREMVGEIRRDTNRSVFFQHGEVTISDQMLKEARGE